MITVVNANIFTARCDALINPVNCVGVMGAGLAKQIKERFPEAYHDYLTACKSKDLVIGKCIVSTLPDKYPHYIIHFPTKDHWQNPSEYSYIQSGLEYLKELLPGYEDIKSIACPLLGCGNGQLERYRVLHMIYEILGSDGPHVSIYYL